MERESWFNGDHCHRCSRFGIYAKRRDCVRHRFLGNFDVINDTGQSAYGFEIELKGLHESEITDVFGGPGRGFPTGRGFDPATSVERYGSPLLNIQMGQSSARK